MTRLERLESRVSLRVVAGTLSVMLHLGLFVLFAFTGGPQYGATSGDTPVIQWVMLEPRKAERLDGIAWDRLKSVLRVAKVQLQLSLHAIKPPAVVLLEPTTQSQEKDGVADDADLIDALDAVDTVEPGEAKDTPATQSITAVATALARAVVAPIFVMPQAQASELVQRIERLARKKLASSPRAQAQWQQDGKRYHAMLTLQRAQNGVELDRVIAEIKADDGDRQLSTRILLRRLSYSQFTQIVDFWDPMVQLHADEVVGRMHVNSRLNVLYDSQARPVLRGKVTTSAGSFNMQAAAPGRSGEVFREGIETRVERISLAEREHPLGLAARGAEARIHEFANDTRIRFFADGSYWWRDSKSLATQFRNEPSGQPVYFVAARGVTLYVQGVVGGKVLVYSPHRIVVEGNLTYAHDPRVVADSRDYLGLVCDKDIDIASPVITGPGDIDVQAALFARRRFVVTNYEHAHPATLRIYGSLAAGSLSATEPRYATRIEFDKRFDRLRPPGFPSINRFTAEEWDGRWTEEP